MVVLAFSTRARNAGVQTWRSHVRVQRGSDGADAAAGTAAGAYEGIGLLVNYG